MTGASLLRSARMVSTITRILQFVVQRTVTLYIVLVDTRASDKDIMHDCEDTFASDPSPVLMLHLTIIQIRRFVHLYTASMYCLSEGNLVWMEVLPT